MARQTGDRTSSAYEETTGAVPFASRLVVVVSCIAAAVALVHGRWGAGSPAGTVPTITPSMAFSTLASVGALSPTDQPPVPSPNPPLSSNSLPSSNPPLRTDQPAVVPRMGIVAGHWGSDTGAMCADGLTEVEINLDVAKRVVNLLQELGYQADLLAEYDPRLEGYQADALLSIHADSCEAFPNATPPASGFKVASVEDSLVPEVEERLVACLAQCYAARTGMYFHANSITYDMIYYHNFYEIDDETPGAIIEVGFMMNDRQILTRRSNLVAQGIVDGMVCFLESERESERP